MPKKSTKNIKNKKTIRKTEKSGNENIENLLKKQTEAILNVMDKKLEKQAATILNVVDKKLEKQSSDILGIMDKRFEAMDKRFEITDQKILRLEDTMDKRFEESEAKSDQRFDRIMTNLDLILKRVTDTDDEVEFIKLDINRIKVVVKEKLGVNLM